jgi:type II restriction enzyme
MPTDENKEKSPELKKAIADTYIILEAFGVPTGGITKRRLERMALCILALAGLKKPFNWKATKDITDGISMRSRDIIDYMNENLEENISSGSYDDIRRKDLNYTVLAGIVVRTKPSAASNDSTRGYAIDREYAELIRQFGIRDWGKRVAEFIKTRPSLAEKLSEKREIKQVPIKLPSGIELFSPGQHNELQKEVVEKFLPRFGYKAELLYIGDTAKKKIYMDEKTLKKMNFFELSHGMLPDIIAYSSEKNWLFLIEAVYTSGPMSKTRVLQLKDFTKDCTAEIIYVSAFLDRATFRKWMSEIAWETEAWIAESPDHMIHFNGSKFLGPYRKK